MLRKKKKNAKSASPKTFLAHLKWRHPRFSYVWGQLYLLTDVIEETKKKKQMEKKNKKWKKKQQSKKKNEKKITKNDYNISKGC